MYEMDQFLIKNFPEIKVRNSGFLCSMNYAINKVLYISLQTDDADTTSDNVVLTLSVCWVHP